MQTFKIIDKVRNAYAQSSHGMQYWCTFKRSNANAFSSNQIKSNDLDVVIISLRFWHPFPLHRIQCQAFRQKQNVLFFLCQPFDMEMIEMRLMGVRFVRDGQETLFCPGEYRCVNMSKPFRIQIKTRTLSQFNLWFINQSPSFINRHPDMANGYWKCWRLCINPQTHRLTHANGLLSEMQMQRWHNGTHCITW